MTGDDFLETLQADVVAILKAVPTLVDVNIIPEDDGDMEAKITRMLGSLTGGSTGKPGCVAVVMLPEITAAEENLPGPPLVVNVKVQVIEQHVINRGADGSGVRSSVGALRVLNALHHHGLAYAALYAGDKSVEPVDGMKKGYLSHLVTLTAHYRGLEGPGKPAQVMASMGEGGGATIAGTISPDMNGFCEEAGTYEGFPYYKTPGATGDPDAGLDDGVLLHVTGDQQWLMRHYAGGVSTHEWLGSNVSAAATPDLSEWSDDTGSPLPTGNPVITLGDEALISLDLATAGAVIYYTTDGSYPDATNGTLYEDPFASPAVGTVIRAAGYKTGLNPGDCCEFVIRDGQGNIPDGEELPDFNEIFNTALTD